MFLSKLKLDLNKKTELRTSIADPYFQHRVVMSGYGISPGRVLFRLEAPSFPPSEGGDASILVQSQKAPDWSRSRLDCGRAYYDVRKFSLTYSAGERYIFRLRANPTVKKKLPYRPNGARVGIDSEEYQRNWLRKKGLDNGFLVIDTVVRDEGLVRSSGSGKRRPLAFKSVRFEGVIEVTSTEKFERSIKDGIGSAKAFGFGLLSMAKA